MQDSVTVISVCLEMLFAGLRQPLRLPASFKVTSEQGKEPYDCQLFADTSWTMLLLY